MTTKWISNRSRIRLLTYRRGCYSLRKAASPRMIAQARLYTVEQRQPK